MWKRFCGDGSVFTDSRGKNKHGVVLNKARMSGLTAQTGEVKPSTAACIPSETKGMMFSPSLVSLYRALRMFRAWTCRTVTHTHTHRTSLYSDSAILDEKQTRAERWTWGTLEPSLSPSAGTASAISPLMVIFNRLQLDDRGSEESKACTSGK